MVRLAPVSAHCSWRCSWRVFWALCGSGSTTEGTTMARRTKDSDKASGCCLLLAGLLVLSAIGSLMPKTEPPKPAPLTAPIVQPVVTDTPIVPMPVAAHDKNSDAADKMMAEGAPLPEPPPPPVIQQPQTYSETAPAYGGRYYSRPSSGFDMRPYTYKGGGSAHRGQKLRRKH